MYLHYGSYLYYYNSVIILLANKKIRFLKRILCWKYFQELLKITILMIIFRNTCNIFESLIGHVFHFKTLNCILGKTQYLIRHHENEDLCCPLNLTFYTFLHATFYFCNVRLDIKTGYTPIFLNKTSIYVTDLMRMPVYRLLFSISHIILK